MLNQFFLQEELQLKHFKHKQSPPQSQFATLTDDKQFAFVHYLVKQETLLFWQKIYWFLVLADSGNDQFFSRVIDTREKLKVNHWINYQLIL